MRKIILDVDTGIDDALAITYLLANKDVEVLAITTGFGNVYEVDAYQNTVNLLNALNRNDVEVIRGADHPINSDTFIRKEISYVIHGLNGIGDAYLDSHLRTPGNEKAYKFIVDSCNKYGDDLTIITLGALTNLLYAYNEDNNCLNKAHSIVIMGGALTVNGNVNKYAEANFLRDVDATIEFFKKDVKSTIVTLDVTLKTLMTEKDLSKWNKYSSTAAKALVDMCRYYYKNEGDSAQELSGCLHDPLAVEVGLNPDIITQYFDCDIKIEEEGESIGRMVLDPVKLIDGPKNNRVTLDVKAEEFVDKFIDKIALLLEGIE